MFCLKLNFYIIQKIHQIYLMVAVLFIKAKSLVDSGTIIFQSSVFGGFLIYYSTKKLYNYQDRRFIGILFYLSLLCITIRSMRSVQSQYQKLLISIDLLPCGRKVLIQHPSIYGYRISKDIDISTISKPKDVYQKSIQKMEHVFPVIMESQLLYLNRYPDFIVNKEILRAVMNLNISKLIEIQFNQLFLQIIKFIWIHYMRNQDLLYFSHNLLYHNDRQNNLIQMQQFKKIHFIMLNSKLFQWKVEKKQYIIIQNLIRIYKLKNGGLHNQKKISCHQINENNTLSETIQSYI